MTSVTPSESMRSQVTRSKNGGRFRGRNHRWPNGFAPLPPVGADQRHTASVGILRHRLEECCNAAFDYDAVLVRGEIQS